jgi:hypothetical protein
MIEISYAKLCGKKIIGVRTDARTPYSLSDPGLGMHFFALFQSDFYIYAPDSEKHVIREIMNLLNTFSKELNCQEKTNLISESEIISSIKNGAEILFHGISKNDLNKPENIKLITKRYIENKTELQKIYPKLIY